MRPLDLTPEVEAALASGCPVVLSVSGGKDSDAMTWAIVAHMARQGLKNPCYLVHADLGRAELKATPAYIRQLAKRVNLPLYIVTHHKFDLLDGIRHKMKTRPDAPPWPNAQFRKCTSDWKTSPIDKWLRNFFSEHDGIILSCIGLRAGESKRRAEKPLYAKREDASTKTRLVMDWLPIQSWSVADVWKQLEGQPHHEAYDRGNQRVSCALCVLATTNDLVNGALQDPDLFRAYCDIEIASGFSFRHHYWLGLIAPQLLRKDQELFYFSKQLEKALAA